MEGEGGGMSIMLQYARAHRERMKRLWPVAAKPCSAPEPKPMPTPRRVIFLPPPPSPEGFIIHGTVKDCVPTKPIPVHAVVQVRKAACKYFGISLVEITSARKTKVLAYQRQVAMYVACTETMASYPEIGRKFGDRDHTTVLYAKRKIGGLLLDQKVAADVDAVRAIYLGAP
jgi:hypothetical protein